MSRLDRQNAVKFSFDNCCFYLTIFTFNATNPFSFLVRERERESFTALLLGFGISRKPEVTNPLGTIHYLKCSGSRPEAFLSLIFHISIILQMEEMVKKLFPEPTKLQKNNPTTIKTKT